VRVARSSVQASGATMRRREFIKLLGGATTWPLAARAQQLSKPVIGFLGSAPPATFGDRIEGFRLGLRDFGYVEGTNITIQYRFAEGHYERLSDLASERVRSKVNLIVTHGTPGSLAPPTFRSSGYQNSSLSLTARPPRHSVSKCPSPSCFARTT